MLGVVPARPAKRAERAPARCRTCPGLSDDGFEELCHLVTDEDPDTALCGKDVAGLPVEPALAAVRGVPGVLRGELN